MTTATYQRTLTDIDRRTMDWMGRNAVTLLRISLGAVFLWFGALKFFPGASPAEGLVEETIRVLTFGMIPDRAAVVTLAGWECLIGIGLISGRALRFTLLLLFLQMAGTMTPLALLPRTCFVKFPLVLTIEGQYIVKNLVLISAGLVVGATLRGGAVEAELRR